MVNKMPGYRFDKYANLRAGYAYMFGHEGKKLLFMGQEFAQEREWSEARELDWYMLQDELNAGMLEYVKELLRIYRKYHCMHEIDNDWGGFEWINADDAERSTYSFIRKSSDGTVSYTHLSVRVASAVCAVGSVRDPVRIFRAGLSVQHAVCEDFQAF